MKHHPKCPPEHADKCKSAQCKSYDRGYQEAVSEITAWHLLMEKVAVKNKGADMYSIAHGQSAAIIEAGDHIAKADKGSADE